MTARKAAKVGSETDEDSTEQVTGGEIVVYEAPDGDARVEVTVGHETVWLSEAQMADLFDRDRSAIGRHIRNVFDEGELPREGSGRILPKTPEGGRPTTVYNLDVIISVGYRVKSKRGTQFRIWATNTLRNHLIKGYTLNERRLIARGVEFEQAVALLSSTLQNRQLVSGEGQGVLEVVQRYSRSWRLLRAYDEDELSAEPENPVTPLATLNISEARTAIRGLRDQMIEEGRDLDSWDRSAVTPSNPS